MPASFNLTLDTLGPAIAAMDVQVAHNVDGSVQVTVAPHTDAGDATQVKIWGDVQNAATEAAAAWSAFVNDAPIVVPVTAGDGVKTVNARLRDDVWNEGASTFVAVTIDTTGPTVTITVNPDRTKISKVAGRDKCTFTWAASENISAYKVCVVPNAASPQAQGTQLGTVGGSVNMSGGAVAANTPIQSVIDGDDLDVAVDDGTCVIKVFAMDTSGNWSA